VAGKAALKQGEKRRKQILRFIASYTKKNGCSPTIAEIANGVGLASPNATRNHLFKLRDDGLITMRPRIARAISIVPQQEEIKKAS
jgi:SOS-response transcriptional repressor LexA